MGFDISQVVQVFSGGVANTNPSLSLGGSPSNIKVTNNSINNLFSQVATTEVGNVYRCIYIVNQSDYLLSNFSVLSVNNPNLLTSMQIAVDIENAEQNLVVSGDIFGGTFRLQYVTVVGGITVRQTTSEIVWQASLSATGVLLQNALNSLTYLGNVSVATNFVTEYTFSILFGGSDGGKDQQLLEMVDFNLLGIGVTQAITQTNTGGPINAVATQIGFENQIPFGLLFSNGPLLVGNLQVGDAFAVWLQRTMPAGADQLQDEIDSSILQFSFEIST